MFCRGGGIFYARDTVTRGKQSLGAKDRVEAFRFDEGSYSEIDKPITQL